MPALLDLVVKLSGHEASLDSTADLAGSFMGGMNLHVPIELSSGTRWLLRIPRRIFTAFPDHITDAIIVSEVATMKWLSGNTSIPVPKVYSYGLSSFDRNGIGVPYMLIEEILGKPFMALDASDGERQKVYEQVARMMGELKERPFGKLGSLTLNKSGEVEVGPVVGERTGSLHPHGPFMRSEAGYLAWVEQCLDLIADQQLHVGFSVDAYLVYDFLREELQQESREAHMKATPGDGRSYLKHTDDKGDHIFVDPETFEVTGLIDWTFARTVPLEEAFGPSLWTADMDAMYGGRLGLSGEDQKYGRILQATCGKEIGDLYRDELRGDRSRRLIFGLATGVDIAWDEAKEIAVALLWLFGETSDGDESWNIWRERRRARCIETDIRFKTLVESVAITM
ncbi:hypothetical protein BDZ85DRAFT_208081 [Elsinoe ampelina]|uniref:Aminoglycoside phosphotransferase domain-containing protein n=1 Tax=Elsinoe ampelina TaxID=302913 RepID=A0A6A6FY93_9PEZI|nr:hypothetical protein BDZ85DRAFT_208081 [Elsinoe ampelina]